MSFPINNLKTKALFRCSGAEVRNAYRKQREASNQQKVSDQQEASSVQESLKEYIKFLQEHTSEEIESAYKERVRQNALIHTSSSRWEWSD